TYAKRAGNSKPISSSRAQLRAAGSSVEAYDLYLRAVALETRRFPGRDEVIDSFEKAISKDSSLAPAYAGLADAYAWRSHAGPNDPNRAAELAKMRAAAEKAYAGFRDKDRAMEQLERAADVGPVRIGFTLNSLEFAFVRDDPRAKALRKKVGLPE